ncbi:MAG: terminase family protein [Patescibacteria group bacterium]|nr:terminase family protein [Patescibacteria group bacterium]
MLLLLLLCMFTLSDIDEIFASGTPDEQRMAYALSTHPFFTFEPRPDNPASFDEQAGFLRSSSLISFACGGNGSGKSVTAAHKAARFLLRQQSPPKPNMPFWILANSIEQVCQTAWDQKLSQIIPRWFIDWEKITWENRNRNFPKAVPLLPWPGRPGKNWVLEFKSYEQGRMQMQAAAIGGAWFTEQFPWEVFEEVIRGCRETMYPGSIFAEFTPIDPVLAQPVESLYERWLAREEGTQPYSFYRLSTEEALKAGHVDQNWYDAFFGMVSDEMLETKKRGAFASYEGAIFQSFDPRIHCFDDDPPYGRDPFTGRLRFPGGTFHRRSIDWGASAEHPFVCLWAARDGMGRYIVYDEYWDVSQHKTVLDHIREIKDGPNREEWRPGSLTHGATYGDPSRPDMFRLFGASGITVTPASNSVYDGIEVIRTLLKPLSNGGPRILIDKRRCPNLVRTMRTYRWKKSSGKGTNPQVAIAEPLKRDDDPVDALRYLVATDRRNRGVKPPRLMNVRSNNDHGVKLGGRMP